MLIQCRLVQIGIVFILFAFVSACNAESINEHKKVNKNILGEKIYSLYNGFGFEKLEVDNGYADLAKDEKYWLAVDSNFEFLTLRTINDVVVEVFIRNPDLSTERGISVGSSLDEFNKLYPDAALLSSYRNGVKRQLIAYCVDSENLEVDFFKEKLFSIRLLDRCR